MQRTEKDYIVALRKGEVSAFDHLFSVYRRRVYAFVIGYLKVEEDAKELVQDVFVKIWEHREVLDENRPFEAFLFTITKNAILNHWRKKKNKQLYLAYLEFHTNLFENDTEAAVRSRELKEIVERIVRQFPERMRVIFRLSRGKGLTNKEISHLLNISKKTVENQISLANKILREKLSGYMG